MMHGARIAGKPRPRNRDPTVIYTYKEIVYIGNSVTGEEVTSYNNNRILIKSCRSDPL
jgi:hypothetical protein